MDGRVAHSSDVVSFIRRASVLAVTLSLVLGNVALCAGWATTPEARMACCADGVACPMHPRRTSGRDDPEPISQAKADSCCALSEGQSSGSSEPTSVVTLRPAVVGPPVLLAGSTPSLTVHYYAWGSDRGRRTGPVPKYVLLSVFLV